MSFWYVDSTNFGLEGDYLAQDEGVKIAQGFAKDKRFDLKQVTLGLITYYKTSIPAYMQSFDGNVSDKQASTSLIDNFVSCFEQAEDMGVFIADSGLYSAENITGTLKKIAWISRVK